MKLLPLDDGPDFESRLEHIRTETQIIAFINDINNAIRNCQNPSEKGDLQYIRQNAYNKKKKIIKEALQNGIKDIEIGTGSSVDRLEKVTQEEVREERRSFGFDEALIIAKKFAPSFLFSICGLTSLTFVYMQSVPLYASSGFTNPELCAFGALLMIVGFSLIHAINKSKLALILCLYASAYEVTLIVQGTLKNENTIVSALVSSNDRVRFLQNKSSREYTAYKISQTKYEDPLSNVYKNSWFKTTQLDPSWEKYEAAQKEFEAKKNEVQHDISSSNLEFLKIFYRLGLVFLCMVSIHNLIKVTIKDKK